ncbi:3-ketosteroid 9alpha-monooxygenase subunit B [Saccharomonospora amisosensis]|uniref:3-ketosteroid 9alpha-monooxygenase subunit B n=1 Tax=Saccharomonospora amisosensis TaxID=1128677 RepID=A0A7X5US37_9PSEU|nr:ferredoxin--NADP reductase [Saccharomonospora amisosensis]NIJ12734.1 3-ketosteroid 9alpha-monooxygenase subunit B [Saccharomonospora amisosensis]
MAESSRVLRVADVVAETAQAHSIVFDTEELDYKPGQFLTVRIPSDECGSVARCYSLSSSPYSGEQPRVTVKRDGYASNWLCDNVRPGSELEILPPSGVFTPRSLDEDLLLFAAGSGITPVMSIVRSVLGDGEGHLTLVYANRDENSVIFAGALRDLAARHPDRLTVMHWLESVQGLPTTEQLRALATPFAQREAFVCGPRPFMSAATSALKSLGLPRSRIHTEKFVSLGGNPFEIAEREQRRSKSTQAAQTAQSPTTLTVSLDGTQRTLTWPRDRKLLDHLLDEGMDAPYSCREGQCSACACRITSGEVKMLNNEVLDSEDIADGIVLACQSLPITDEVSISYE